MTENNNTINLWSKDGAHAGTITIAPQGCVDLSIIQVQLTICGLENFDYWWKRVDEDVKAILTKHSTGIIPKEIKETIAEFTKSKDGSPNG